MEVNVRLHSQLKAITNIWIAARVQSNVQYTNILGSMRKVVKTLKSFNTIWRTWSRVHVKHLLRSLFNLNFSRLVQYLRQRINRRCSCQNGIGKYVTENRRHNPQFNMTSKPKMWTISERQDPVYEDLDIANFSQKRKKDSREKRNSSNIIYGYITAKEVAKFRPCSISSIESRYY